MEILNSLQQQRNNSLSNQDTKKPPAFIPYQSKTTLNASEIQRYSRQMLVQDMGHQKMESLKQAKVLVVGAGGLGCPLLMYLAGAGIHRLGIVDHDHVDISNLHRQIAHQTTNVGMTKVQSIVQAIQALNPLVECTTYPTAFSESNGLELVSKYDVVVDATDNSTARYLINDACVLGRRPLVSGSALGLEGSITVYNYDGGPCLRCVYPKPTKSSNCADNGVLGPVPGVIGCLQAIETIKLITGIGRTLKGNQCLYDAYDGQFRHFKLRSRRPDCNICGANPTITCLSKVQPFCLSSCPDHLASEQQQVPTISVQEYNQIALDRRPHLLLDVREKVQFDLCALPGSLNIPLLQLSGHSVIDTLVKKNKCEEYPVYIICRRGVDSRDAVIILNKAGLTKVWDVAGGLVAWSRDVDPEFPTY